MDRTEDITVVLTSCDRHDLLAQTLDSFFAVIDYPIARVIVVEDGRLPAPVPTHPEIPIDSIATGARAGQIAAIDYAYSRVATPWIFHLEDDWEFYRGGFIERSLDVLRAQPDCLQVYLRAVDDTNGHPIREGLLRDGAAEWQRMDYGFYNGLFDGFSFNPGLRRLRDYVAINGYGIHTLGAQDWTDLHGSREAIISRIYRRMGMFAGILVDSGGVGYVRHTGDERHVFDKALDDIRGLG